MFSPKIQAFAPVEVNSTRDLHEPAYVHSLELQQRVSELSGATLQSLKHSPEEQGEQLFSFLQVNVKADVKAVQTLSLIL
jgi:hypothetical protein